MNVYTEPQSTTYLLWQLFKFPLESGDVWAISVPNSVALILNTAYTLVTIYIFNAIWNVTLYTVMLVVPVDNSLARNYVLSVFWNSAEPFTAWFNMATLFQRMCLRSPRYFHTRDGSAKLVFGLTLLAALSALGSTAGGLLIAPSMVIGKGAPANPQAVWVPLIGELGSMFSRHAMIKSPAAVRAIGSAEASKVTLRNKVSIYQERTDASTNEKPDFFIKYHYNITGPEFGISQGLGLLHSVKGSCWTEYGWLRHSNTTPGVDYYQPWQKPDLEFPTPSSTGPNMPRLGFVAQIHPDHIKSPRQNVSFALLYQTGHIPSFSESSDAMYMTERMPSSKDATNMTNFRVKAERPILSCWQDSTTCAHGKCGTVEDALRNGVPPGLTAVLAQLQGPQVMYLANRLGPAALMSFFSPTPGNAIDAASSSTFADMERLILGAYLQSRNTLRDATMVDPVSGFKNAVLDTKGQQLEGTGSFILEVASITALSVSALVTIPAIATLLAFMLVICNHMAHPRTKTSNCREQRYRMIDLATPNLYRAANITGGNADNWDYVPRLHPVPTNELAVMSMAGLAGAKVEADN